MSITPIDNTFFHKAYSNMLIDSLIFYVKNSHFDKLINLISKTIFSTKKKIDTF